MAVVGLGVGEQHARAYLQSGCCRLRFVYDLDESRASRVLARLGQGRQAESFEAILADESVDVVSIASYDDVHFAQVVAALRAGKHVFVEKPLCRSIAELRTIKEAWKAAKDRHLACNLVLRAAPVYRWLKTVVEGGELGDIYAMDGDYLYGRIEKITEGWRKAVDDYSVMQGGGVHLVDLMVWMTGQRPASVTAMGNRMCTKGTAFHYDDFMCATFRFPSGMIGRVTANFGCVHRHQHVVRLFGTKGTFLYDDLGPRLHTTRDPNSPATALELATLPAAKGDLIGPFVSAILKGKDPALHAQQDFDVISICVAADQAAASSQLIPIEYV